MKNVKRFKTKEEFRKLGGREQLKYLDYLDRLSVQDEDASKKFDELYEYTLTRVID